MRASPAPAAQAKTAAKPRAAARTAAKRPASKKSPSPVVALPTKKKAAKPAAVAPTPVDAAPNGGAKQKLVRDSFTMPTHDFGLIHTLKERALTFRRPTKKSELLRAGLHALAALNDAKLRSVLEGLAPLKSGRPKKAG